MNEAVTIELEYDYTTQDYVRWSYYRASGKWADGQKYYRWLLALTVVCVAMQADLVAVRFTSGVHSMLLAMLSLPVSWCLYRCLRLSPYNLSRNARKHPGAIGPNRVVFAPTHYEHYTEYRVYVVDYSCLSGVESCGKDVHLMKFGVSCMMLPASAFATQEDALAVVATIRRYCCEAPKVDETDIDEEGCPAECEGGDRGLHLPRRGPQIDLGAGVLLEHAPTLREVLLLEFRRFALLAPSLFMWYSAVLFATLLVFTAAFTFSLVVTSLALAAAAEAFHLAFSLFRSARNYKNTPPSRWKRCLATDFKTIRTETRMWYTAESPRFIAGASIACGHIAIHRPWGHSITLPITAFTSPDDAQGFVIKLREASQTAAALFPGARG